MQTPIDLSYLADNVVLLRFFETAGRVQHEHPVIRSDILLATRRAESAHVRRRPRQDTMKFLKRLADSDTFRL